MLVIPDWFAVYETIISAAHPSVDREQRFRDLVNKMAALESLARADDDDGRVGQPWNKEFHNPNPAWHLETRRVNGGWWRCRSGDDAPPAEKACRQCHPRPKIAGASSTASVSASPPSSPSHSASGIDNTAPAAATAAAKRASAKEQYDKLMADIARCMHAVAERDKKVILARRRPAPAAGTSVPPPAANATTTFSSPSGSCSGPGRPPTQQRVPAQPTLLERRRRTLPPVLSREGFKALSLAHRPAEAGLGSGGSGLGVDKGASEDAPGS